MYQCFHETVQYGHNSEVGGGWAKNNSSITGSDLNKSLLRTLGVKLLRRILLFFFHSQSLSHLCQGNRNHVYLCIVVKEDK